MVMDSLRSWMMYSLRSRLIDSLRNMMMCGLLGRDNLLRSLVVMFDLRESL